MESVQAMKLMMYMMYNYKMDAILTCNLCCMDTLLCEVMSC